ncbi:ankyrin repeat family protein [Carex rostrata]
MALSLNITYPLLPQLCILARGTLPFLPQPSSSLYSSPSPLPTLRNSSKRIFCANSTGEEPNDGFDSVPEEDEIEDQEQEEEKEHDNRCSETGAAGSSYEEDLIREVEQLLTPEERAILDMNKTPNLNKISTPKWNPLHTFALAIQIPLMDKLLESGIDINSVDKDGVTPLHKAVMGKKEAVISHLLRKRANPHVRDRDGATPLHYAVQVGALQTVKLLIKYKVDVNVADNEGWTPLHLAIQGRNRDIAKVLLVNGADRTRRNQDGKTPLDLSLCYGKDFKSYDLTSLLKLVPANRDP